MTDAQLLRYVREFRSGILGERSSDCMCFAICAPLAALLSVQCGMECELVEVDLEHDTTTDLANHCWLRLPDGRALDPTADQFGFDLPPVYLGEPIPDLHFK